MIYSSCPTCGFCIGIKVFQFENKKNEICNNPELNDTQRNEEISKALRELKLRRYCCKMRIMTSKDLVKDILPIND
jgi:DNA-directed RNA polymerase subunit N (RpoN/RPB10)